MERSQLKYLLETVMGSKLKLSSQEKKIIDFPKKKIANLAKAKKFNEIKKIIEPVVKNHKIEEINKMAMSTSPDYYNVKKEFINLISKNFDKKTADIIAIPLALIAVGSEDSEIMKKDLKDKVLNFKTLEHFIVFFLIRWVYVSVAFSTSSYLIPLIPVALILVIYYLISQWKTEEKQTKI